jgi:hypothetical protein
MERVREPSRRVRSSERTSLSFRECDLIPKGRDRMDTYERSFAAQNFNDFLTSAGEVDPADRFKRNDARR